MTSEEIKECISLIAEYAQTKMLLVDDRQKRLIKQFFEMMSKYS